MLNPSYVFRRRESGVFFFRWPVPVAYRDWFEGKRELKHTLRTTDRRLALRLARRLSALLDRDILRRMAASKNDQYKSSWGLFAKLVQNLDGTRSLEVQTDSDPTRAEEERKNLEAVVSAFQGGNAAAATAARPEAAKLSAIVKGFLDEGDSAKRWTLKTKQEMVSALALLVEVVGDVSVSKLDRKEVARFKDVLTKLPSNRTKNPLYRGKSALDLAALSIPAAHRMQPNTVNKVLTRVGSLLRWATLHGHIALNYAEGLGVKTGKRADEEREPYTDTEVRKVLEAVLSGANGSDRAPYMKWVPLVGAYSGMRLNEICQLSIADIKEVDGIAAIEVNDTGEGKRVKTANARRTVPIHPALVDAGLLSYVETMRAKGSVRLFPELSKGRDGYGQVVSKWFARFRERLGLDREFHALRHTVTSKLREEGIPEDVIADLLGHSRSEKETFGRYAKAASVKRLHEALSKLRY